MAAATTTTTTSTITTTSPIIVDDDDSDVAAAVASIPYRRLDRYRRYRGNNAVVDNSDDDDDMYAEPMSVFFGGPPGIGKRRMLRRLARDARYVISRVNYETLNVAYSGDENAIIRHLLTRRIGNMIYEHTALCLVYVHVVVQHAKSSSVNLNFLEAYNFYEFCRDKQRRESKTYAAWREQRMLLCLDLRGNYFQRVIKRVPFVYFYVIAYLAIMAEHQLYPRAYMSIILDDNDVDPVAESLGIYDHAKSLALRTCQISFCTSNEAIVDQLGAMHRPLSII